MRRPLEAVGKTLFLLAILFSTHLLVDYAIVSSHEQTHQEYYEGFGVPSNYTVKFHTESLSFSGETLPDYSDVKLTESEWLVLRTLQATKENEYPFKVFGVLFSVIITMMSFISWILIEKNS